MKKRLTPLRVYERLKNQLALHWIAGRQHANRPFKDGMNWSDRSTLIGHLNLIHRNFIQVLGEIELKYLQKLRKNTFQDTLEQIFSPPTAAVVICDAADIPEGFIEKAEKKSLPLFTSKLSSNDLVNDARYYLGQLLADTYTLHGVFMEVMGTGVLITGQSGIGKSELALELITRGHRLIADDAPEFTRLTPDILEGSCPDLLAGYLEVRGLGILNIATMYGDNALKRNKYLRMIIHLHRMSSVDRNKIDRLYGARSTRNILGVNIPEIALPVAPGRNMAVMVEAAIRNNILLQNGYNATEEYIEKQRQFMNMESV